jgi:septum formation protein
MTDESARQSTKVTDSSPLGPAPPLLRDWHVVLASASTSRRRLLLSVGLEIDVVVSGVDEDAIEAQLADPNPRNLASTLARAKAMAVVTDLLAATARGQNFEPTIVIGADSVLDFDGKPMGKPIHPDVALARAKQLRGGSAELITGHCVVALSGTGPQERRAEYTATTEVRFSDPTDSELAAYVASGEPLHVAGGFTLDGLSAPFIAGVVGDPSNVIGLSLPNLRILLRDLGIEWIV